MTYYGINVLQSEHSIMIMWENILELLSKLMNTMVFEDKMP